MSDTCSCASCGSCGCDCFGNSDGDAALRPEHRVTYGAISTGDVVADVTETALDITTDAYEPIPTNTSRKKRQNADGETDADMCSDMCRCVAGWTLALSVLSIIGK